MYVLFTADAIIDQCLMYTKMHRLLKTYPTTHPLGRVTEQQ